MSMRVALLGGLMLAGSLAGLVQGAESGGSSTNATAAAGGTTNASSAKAKVPIPKIIRGPYLQMGTPTNMVVRWRTDIAGHSRVRYGTNLLDLKQSARANGDAIEHIVLLTNLVPDTKYFYLVETNPPPPASTNKTTTNAVATAAGKTNAPTTTSTNAAKTSASNVVEKVVGTDKWFFQTAPIPGRSRPFRAWVLGDPGTKRSGQFAVRDAYYQYTEGRYTDLWLMLGDNAYTAGKDKEYQESVFDVYKDMFRKSVLWPALGNHDGGSANSATQSGVYYDIFTLPTLAQAGGVMSGTEAYYSYDYANAHFICIDSHDSDRGTNGAMARWLRQDMAQNRLDWQIAYFHHPPYTKGSHDSDNEKDSEGRMRDMRQNILPILEAGGVDLVLAGHSHVYERSYLLRGHFGKASTFANSMILDGGSSRPDRGGLYRKGNLGTVYIVAGSSGQTNKPTVKTNSPAQPTNLVAVVEASAPLAKEKVSSSTNIRRIPTSAKGAYQLRTEREEEADEIDDDKEKALRGETTVSLEKGRLDHPAMCFATNALGSLILDFDGPRLQGVFLNEKGAILDKFSIIKSRSARK